MIVILCSIQCAYTHSCQCPNIQLLAVSNTMNRLANVHVEFAQAGIHSEALMSAELYLCAGCICMCILSMYD